MKLTFENYEQYVPKKDWQLIHGLLIDLEELNKELENKEESYRKLYVDIQDYHDEYSPERTDTCPDYYGMYRLYPEKDPYNSIGTEMTIDELDNALCLLINFMEIKL